MTDKMDDNHPLDVNAENLRKVPRRKAYARWVKVGFFFAVGVLGLVVLAEIGFELFAATLAIITPFATAMVIALLLDPIVDRMQRASIPRVLAVSIVFLFFLGAVAAVLAFAVPTVIGQASTLTANIPIYINSNKANVNDFLSHHKSIGPFKLPKNWDVLTSQITVQIGAFIQRSAGGLATAVIVSVSTIVEVIITLIVGFYLLVDIDRIRARCLFLAPTKYRRKLDEIGQDIGKVFAAYIRGMTIVCMLYGFTTQIAIYGLAFMPKYGNVSIGQYALLLGVAAGVLYAIPYLGSFTIGIVTFLVAFSAGGFRFGVIALVVTLIVNQTFDNVIAPRILGGGNGLNPVLVIFSLSLGGALFGVCGLLFSVPVAASIQVIFFRLFPKLTEPTPESFLLAQGVPPGKGKTSQILESEEQRAKDSQTEKDAEKSAIQQ
jgi:predicted PurR-regulated permease PerM